MSKVTIFPRADITSGGIDTEITNILAAIKDGKWEDRITNYRDVVEEFTKNSPEAKKAKKALPYFTGSGTFINRAESGLKEHSGFIIVDVDGLGDKVYFVKDKIQRDKFTYSVFVSAGGEGLAIILRIGDPENHQKAFKEAEKYYLNEYGIKIDFLADVSRARFISWDETLYLNENAETFSHKEIYKSDEIKTGGDISNGQETHEEFVSHAIEHVSKTFEYKEGQRHNFILRVACHCNRHGIPKSVVDAVIREQFPHFAQNPSNAISGAYKNYATEFGKYQKENGSVSISLPTPTPTQDPIGAIEITFDFEPEIKDPVMTIAGVRVCSIGNIFSLVAAPGTGKSSVCEAMGAAFINPDCDGLGIEVAIPEGKKLVYIDGERTHEDCKNGFLRIARRARMDSKPEIRDGNRLKDFRYESFIGIPTVDMRIKELERIIEQENPGLLIIDDVSCIVKDTNDNTEADKVLMYLVAKANSIGFGLVLTVHPNPGSDKPRGHIGSATLRKSEAVYALKRAPDNKAIRRLTTDHEFMKTRNAIDINEVNFTWSDDSRMFVSTEYEMSIKEERIY